MPRQTVAVVGLGSIGGIAAGSLWAAGRHQVVACVRTAIDRLVVERPEDVVEAALPVLTDSAQARPVDWVLLCTKAHQSDTAAPWLARLCGPGTRVAALQNGIGHAVRLAPLVGEARVVPVLVYYNGERLAPDRVRLRRAGAYELAMADDTDGQALAALFAGSGLRTFLSADAHTLAWRKLLINAVANPISALTLQRQAVFRRDDIQELCGAVLDEAVAVARADGADLAADEAARTLATLLTYPPEAGTSMYFDRAAGRALEIEAITGSIVAAAERHGIAVPVNRAMLALLRAVSDAAGS